VPRRVETTGVQNFPVPPEGVIIVRMWWEDAGAGTFAIRARVVSTLNMASDRSITASASTVEGILGAVGSSLAGFVAARPGGEESGDG
jgi:hypothetical protein